MSDQSGIYSEDPFVAPIEERDPARRLRGRLVLPVAILTAGDEDQRTGLTVSSVMVAEGAPPLLYALLGPTTDLWYVIQETRRFVAHLATVDDREAADVFAGLRPAPGGPFLERAVEQTGYGPVLTDLLTRAHCTYQAGVEESYSVLVSATIDHVEPGPLDDPLVYFRGRYRRLA